MLTKYQFGWEKVKKSINDIIRIMKSSHQLKREIITILLLCILLLISVNMVNSVPLPIYGKIEYTDGESVTNASVNVSSEYGYRRTFTENDGYWQVDVGDPVNWPIGTNITVQVIKTLDSILWIGSTELTLQSGSTNVGTIILKSDDINGSNQTILIPPVAQIINQGFFEQTVGAIVFLDGLDSYDPDGSIIGYRWDFNGDGVFDTSWSDNGVYTHIFNMEGIYNTVLQVMDNDNLVDTVDFIVDISPDPVIVEIIGTETILSSQAPPFIYQWYGVENISNVSWVVDDKHISYENTLFHQFVSPGYHHIMITVTADSNKMYHDMDQILVILDTDKDLISDEIETIIGTPIWTNNKMTTLVIDGSSHLLVDTNQDETYDIFFNITAMNYSKVVEEEEFLLIDNNLDEYYEYTYTNGTLTSYDDPERDKDNGDDSEETPGFSLICVSCGMIIIILYLKRKRYYPK
jgi:hypothetical protein